MTQTLTNGLRSARFVAMSVLAVLAMAGAQVTAQELTQDLYVPAPNLVNLVFNRSASRDAANTSGYSFYIDNVLSPSTNHYANANATQTGQTYAVEIGRAYDVGSVEFVFGRYLNNNYIPLTFNLYAAPTDVANLIQPGYKIADQSTPGLIYSDRSPAKDALFQYQQIRYNLPSSMSLYKFGVEVTSWQALGAGTDQRGFLLAASANPVNAPLKFDGEIGLFSNTWNSTATVTASHTSGDNIAETAYYGLDHWGYPRWYSSYTGGIDGGLDITMHLPDTYKMDGVRWAAGQNNWPVHYRIYAASSATTPGAGDWTPVTAALTFVGGNQGTLVPFDAPFVGNWVQIRAVDGIGSLFEATQFHVYGKLSIPEPTSLALLALAGLALGRRQRRA